MQSISKIQKIQQSSTERIAKHRMGSNCLFPSCNENHLPYDQFATWRGSQSSLSKVFGFTKTRPEKLFNPTSPTNSYSSEDYATVGSFFSPPPTQHPPQPPTTTPPPSLPSHRVSAPPTESAPVGCTLPRQHRRVKSISDIDVIAAAPV